MQQELVIKNSWEIYLSVELDPFKNLSIESWLLAGNFKSEHVLLLYRNNPCLVLGRFQNPLKEIHLLNFLKNSTNKEEKLKQIVRRRSGGGTVYHDLGNWNFCFIRRGPELKREENLLLLKNALSCFGVSVNITDKYDLLMNGLKVTGTAARKTLKMCLHHGTLLVDANLKALRGQLGQNIDWHIESKAIDSRPMPVTNLSELGFNSTIDELAHFMAKQLKAKVCPISFEIDPTLKEEYLNLISDKWVWNETPKFILETNDFQILVDKGVLIKIMRNSGPYHLKENMSLKNIILEIAK